MPPKRKRQHEFDESYEFKNDATYSAAVEWFTILKLQPELAAADWDAICEKMAFNLGQESVTKDSLAGGTGETADLIYDTAPYDIEEVPLGTKLALKRVLLDLRTGEAAACLSATDRRHGDGQRIANATFPQFLLNSVKEYGDDARKGIKHFRLDKKRAQAIEDIITETWNLIKEKPDAKAVYANNTPGSKPYNYIFQKVLIRKIKDEHALYLKELKEGGDLAGENVDPNAANGQIEAT